VSARGVAMCPRAGPRVYSSARGAALIDVVLTCGFIALLAAVLLPSVHASRERDQVRMAARHLTSTMHLLRVEAIRRNRTVAMRLDPTDLGAFAVYVDGDGDGVRQSDIDAGTDIVLHQTRHIQDAFAGVALRIPITVPTPDGAGVLDADSDPIRIGNTNFLSFNPIGTATSGTIYLSGRGGGLIAVRVFGATGRLRVLQFQHASNTWRED